ncbi:MAG: hypothetical protein ACTSU3_09635 [Candidatus Thorarchaeota archaeon]
MVEDTTRQRCNVCKKNQATHMCEDCGITLCSECLDTKSNQYVVCIECHHNLGLPPPGEKIEVCTECDSEDLSTGRRVEEICPRCHSSRIISIEDKRRTMSQDLRHAIMSIHHGHTKLREFNNQLTSAKRLLASLRMANFLHYNWLEEKIEALNEEVGAIKSRVSNQAEIVAKRMVAETKGLMDFTSWTSEQFPFIEGVTQRVMHIGEQYRFNVDDAIKESKITLDDILQQLEGLDYYRKKFAPFYEVSELSVGEFPVCALPDIRVAGSDFLRHDKATGTLHITNKRLVFIAERGLVRKKTEIIFDFPLMYLNSIEEDGRIRKKLILKMKQGFLKIACNEQTGNVISDYIEIAKKFDRYVQKDLQKIRKLEQRIVNVSDVRLKIEGLVYSLLNPVSYPKRDSMGFPVHPLDSPFQHSLRSPTYDNVLSQQDGYREHLEPTRDPSHSRQNQPYNTEFDALQRNAASIESAISETVHLLRNGRIIPEDFIRRYKGLARDSYNTRHQMERFQTEPERRRW